ncbi:C40 family peptidase [Conexibacter woesei]|uniref:C40 family peptidase n=1 Tax=Conexibacter woesei TaxID=191495 RepID=UPI000427FB07|nr:C40 family peptidase [Conexibacter woesei]
MVFRRLPILLATALLAAFAAAPAAHAQQAATDSNGAYSDADGSYWGPDDSYDDYSDDDAGGDPYDNGATGGQTPGVSSPYTPPTTGTTTTLPGQTSPSTQPPTGTLPPTPGTLPTIPVTRTIAGKTAQLRTDGKAAIPRGAPKVVQTVIAAANRIIGKPYLWGGGHARLIDKGYDCSGSVSFALIGASLLASPEVSGALAHWGAAGNGRWISVYANKGHVYMEVAGLRLDTSPVGDYTGRMGVRWRPLIGKRNGFHTRHPLGL